MLRNRVIAAAAPRMTSHYPFEGEEEALERAVFSECLQRVLRTGGGISACRGSKRGYAGLIDLYQDYEGEHADLSDQSTVFSRALT